MIKFVKGDIFVNEHRVSALAHGCNTMGLMGRGIALDFKTRWPEMYNQYRILCSELKEQLAGDVFIYDDRALSRFVVCNLFTQIETGPCAEERLVRLAFMNCKRKLDLLNVNTLAMPAIGAGIGGLSLPVSKQIAKDVFSSWKGYAYYYEEYKQGE